MAKTFTLASAAGLFLVGTLAGKGAFAAANASFEDPHFSGSGKCVLCHDNLADNQGNDISIVKAWSTTMMANATRDPYWRAKVASELHRNPGLSSEINDKCSRCHAPMANESAKKDGAAVEIFGSGFLDPTNAYYNHALDGVSCTLCHQIADDGNLGTLAGSSGNFTIVQKATRADRPAYGQYSNPLTGPMRNNVQYTPQQGVHTSQSKMCGVCHDLKTPFVDANGDVASTTPESEFPEQMAYSEWNNSDYKVGGAKEKSCQDCHMPTVQGSVKIANRPQMVGPRPDFARHSFYGANTTMMDILDKNKASLEVTATGFDQSIQATRSFLQSAASISVESKNFVGNTLQVKLKITNHSGHKLPSGYPSRRVFIHFKVTDKTGQMLFESGKLNVDGSISGVATDADPSAYEPHYDRITSADQVQVYEPIMQNTDGNVTHTLLRAASYIKDNRLTPAGFDKSAAPGDVAVKGAASADANFDQGSDTIEYFVDTGLEREVNITAELIYQTLSYGHLQDMFTDAASVPEVSSFKTQFEAASIRSEKIDSASATTITDDAMCFPVKAPNGKLAMICL